MTKYDRLAFVVWRHNEMIAEINQNISKGMEYFSNTYQGKVKIAYISADLWIHTGTGLSERSYAIHGGELEELYKNHIIS